MDFCFFCSAGLSIAMLHDKTWQRKKSPVTFFIRSTRSEADGIGGQVGQTRRRMGEGAGHRAPEGQGCTGKHTGKHCGASRSPARVESCDQALPPVRSPPSLSFLREASDARNKLTKS